MTPANLNTMSSTGRSRPLSHHRELPVPVEIRPMRSARRLRLRFDAERRVLTLSCPARTSARAALDWAAEQREWVEAQIASALPAEPLVPGARIPLEGRDIELVWEQSLGRVARLEGDELRCGGPRIGFERRIERFLKARALDFLSRDTADFAAGAGVVARAVSVGDAGTRWGSCSSAGRIRYSWRLILAPAEARRYVAAHEVAHLVHLDHGQEFRALEAKLFGASTAAPRALLRRLGPRLRRIGRRD
jgi:predicted metal-dependent hydrolase